MSKEFSWILLYLVGVNDQRILLEIIVFAYCLVSDLDI